jgi:hypothetical protein
VSMVMGAIVHSTPQGCDVWRRGACPNSRVL